MWGDDPAVEGAILLSPPLIRAGDADLDAWAADGRPLVALVPELDDYLRPGGAGPVRAGPAGRGHRRAGAKHLWVGERYVRIVLNEIVRRVNPGGLAAARPSGRTDREPV